MNDAAKQQDDSHAPDRRVTGARWFKKARRRVARALRAFADPVLQPLAKHQARIRRWGGVGGLALGIGFLAGGLEPIGLSLILVGVAVLLVEFERSGQATSERKRK